jgi:hypothetical protein
VSPASFAPVHITLSLPCGEQKRQDSAAVKYWQTTLVILATLVASLALAADFRTIHGKEYKDATINRLESDGIVLRTKSGILKVYFTELPKAVQQRFGYDSEAEAKRAAAEANKAAEGKRIDEQKATERAEKERNAQADLKRSQEQFQASEQRALQSYESAAKGTVSGQVFVCTHGGENFKLGAVQVALFARDGVDILLAGLKNKIEHDFFDGNRSGAFYFAYLQLPIQTAETDADGKFAIEVPKTGRFVIAAQAKRSVGNYTERYYWLQPVSLESGQRIQNLSNNNLTSTTGTSSFIHTED